LLRSAVGVERIIKGMQFGNPWQALTSLLLEALGARGVSAKVA